MNRIADEKFTLEFISGFSEDQILFMNLIHGGALADNHDIEQIRTLSKRCVEFFWNADEPRFTPQDLADALLDTPFVEHLESVLAANDDDFIELATAAAEEYRQRMSWDIQNSEKSFAELIEELAIVK